MTCSGGIATNCVGGDASRCGKPTTLNLSMALAGLSIQPFAATMSVSWSAAGHDPASMVRVTYRNLTALGPSIVDTLAPISNIVSIVGLTPGQYEVLARVEFNGEHGEWASATSYLATVPVVQTSIIADEAPDGILVTWDQPMHGSGSLQDAMDVVVDGVHHVPDSVQFNPNDPREMVIVLPFGIGSGQAVTWAYDDSHPTEVLESLLGVEADNQTYLVINQVMVHLFFTSNGNRFLLSNGDYLVVK